MRPLRRALAAPFRWAAHGLLLDNRLTNEAALALLKVWAVIRGSDEPPT